MQQEITPIELLEAQHLMTEFSDGFEIMYVEQHADHMHFVWPSIHTVLHFSPETTRVGPGIITSQWTME